MHLEKIDMKRNTKLQRSAVWFFLGSGVLALLGFAIGMVHGAQIVDWSRVTGKVVKIDRKANVLTMIDRDGYPLAVHWDSDATLVVGKEVREWKDVQVGDKVAIANMPQAVKPKDPDEPAEGGVVAPAKR